MNTYMKEARRALTSAGLLQSSTSGWFAGFAVGAGVGLVSGAIVALLVTPTNGREMRREIGWRAKQLAERTQGAIADARHTVKGKLESELHRGRNEVPIG